MPGNFIDVFKKAEVVKTLTSGAMFDSEIRDRKTPTTARNESRAA
jgi:hypothetical protein